MNADGILNKNVYRYGSNNVISRIDSEGQEDVGLQELLNAKYVVFLKEIAPLYTEPQFSETYHIEQVPEGTFVGQPVYVYEETDTMYYVALQFYEGREAVSVKKDGFKRNLRVKHYVMIEVVN